MLPPRLPERRAQVSQIRRPPLYLLEAGPAAVLSLLHECRELPLLVVDGGLKIAGLPHPLRVEGPESRGLLPGEPDRRTPIEDLTR